MIELLILILAVYGLSALVTQYDGPGDIFLKMRIRYEKSPFHCTVCMAAWLVVPLVLIQVFTGSAFVIPLSVIGAIIILENV